MARPYLPANKRRIKVDLTLSPGVVEKLDSISISSEISKSQIVEQALSEFFNKFGVKRLLTINSDDIFNK